MKRFWDRVAPRIWTRLFFLILTAVLLTWTVVGVAVYSLGAAQSVVTGLGADQVPRLMQTTRLSASAADLAMLSNRILSAEETDPKALEATLRASVAELDQLLRDGFDTPLTQEVSLALQTQLAAVIHMLDTSRRVEERLRSKVDRLRWLNVDIQDETAALVADFAYNIEALTRSLTRESDPDSRRALAQRMLAEQELHAVFVDLGNAVSIATTLAIQSSASQSPGQLSQFEALLLDALARVNDGLAGIPDKPEYLSLRQAAETLNRLTIGPEGLVEDRQAWQTTRARLRERLDASFTLLTEIQTQLRHLTERQREDLSATSDDFATSAVFTMRLLLAMTAVAAIAGLAILFLYIRPSIIRPMQALTTAMRRIADGKTPALEGLPTRNDEIAQLAEAVGAFHTSVRERDQAIEKLRQTQSELVQAGKMAALGTLSAGISHELNQPLGAIRQRLHLAGKALAAGDTGKARRQTDKIEEMVTRMERIIDHLRRFARRSNYTREVVALAPLVAEAEGLLGSKMAAHRVTLALDPALREAKFMGDPVLIEQVLVNLMSNAIDAIAETGEPGEITLRPEQAPPGMIAFSVLDTGKGLGDLAPERAIDPFVTTKAPGDGLGLGLSISFNIVTGMGGSLKLAHRKGRGTRATIMLPEGAG
ncbi:MAG: ATP-binding protein [Paracoccaceae bacterium]|jgi:two-component system C4-dicarboxylate transport sensor histidine kinase DctB